VTHAIARPRFSAALALLALGVLAFSTPAHCQDFGGGNASRIRSRAVQACAPTDAQVLAWSAANNRWECSTISTGAASFSNQSANVVFAGPSSGSAAAPAFRALVTADLPGSATGSPPPTSQQNGDFWVVRTSATVLTIGPACSSTFPCKVAFGTTVFTLTTAATATISAGTDTAYIYVSDAQVLTVGVNSASFTCSGCTRAAGITGFPATAFPLWNWTSTSGTWDVSGGSDQRVVTQKGADPLASYVLTSANTQLKNAVTTLPTANMATVSLRRVCPLLIGADNAASVLADADIGPQGQQCKIPYAATVVEIDVNADAGTPSAIVRKKHCATSAAGVCTSWTSTDFLSGALAAAASNFDACSNTGGTTGLDAVTTCSNTLQNTSVAIGDWIELKSGTAGGTAKRLSVNVIYTVN